MNEITAGILSVTLWISGIVYMNTVEKREHFRKRFLGCTGIYLLLSGSIIYSFMDNLIVLGLVGRVLGFLLLAVFLYVCWDVSLLVGVYYAIWAMMSWQLMYELWYGITGILQAHYGQDLGRDVLSCMLLFAVCNPIAAYTIAKWIPEDTQKIVGPRQFWAGMVVFLAFEIVGYAPGNVELVPTDLKWMTIYLVQILLAVILYLQNELFKKSAMRQELAVMNMLWKKEQEQYELSRENIALINQKCHDLKHQIRAIRTSNKEDVEKYLREMEESVSIYEAIVKTGNEVLDTILTEKSLYCREREITVSCVADGSQMEFINTVDLYAILGNALDNAIEAVQGFCEQEKRQIDVMIYRQQQFLVIHIVNPSNEKLVYEEELPVTTKKDKRYHGFGLKSIRYLVKKYDGYLTVSEEDGCFSLKILMPIPT